MTALESVRRRPRAFWSDARFFLGVVLIAASVAGVWFVVASARQTVPVFAAAHTIVPGEALSGDAMRVVDVALGQVGDAYLAPEALEEGQVATRTIEAGELVPQSAVGAAGAATVTTVVVRSTVDVPASVDTGTVVEVWSAPLVERGVYDTPRILVADATVAAVTRDDSMIGGGAAALELVIPRADVAAVLAAMSAGAALSIVPTAGAGR
ncbi:SAF domain-containing protein [uncultured Microbacterium sp.]|uniref:SAF domain-containing protein n=1 Tax=uncultured Microbacterium sp. TaxID=191216 RepID=UPI0035CA246D